MDQIHGRANRNLYLLQNVDVDNDFYSGSGIGFDSRLLFLFQNFDWGKNVVIFGADNSSVGHSDNEKKYIIVLGFGPRQRLHDFTITTEAKYSINLTRSNRNFC